MEERGIRLRSDPPEWWGEHESIADRLEYLRGEIEAEHISWGEIAELQGLAEHIDPSDVVLREWAGIPEHEEPPTEAESRLSEELSASEEQYDLARTILRNVNHWTDRQWQTAERALLDAFRAGIRQEAAQHEHDYHEAEEQD